MKQEVMDLILQLSQEGQRKAGQFQDQNLESLYDKCSVRTPEFFEGRLDAALQSKSTGEHYL